MTCGFCIKPCGNSWCPHTEEVEMTPKTIDQKYKELNPDTAYCVCGPLSGPCRFCFYGGCTTCYTEEGNCYCTCKEKIKDKILIHDDGKGKHMSVEARYKGLDAFGATQQEALLELEQKIKAEIAELQSVNYTMIIMVDCKGRPI